eukprot:5071413-Pyramimonas_sp.AAC.1
MPPPLPRRQFAELLISFDPKIPPDPVHRTPHSSLRHSQRSQRTKNTWEQSWSRGSPGTSAAHRGDTDHPPVLGQGSFLPGAVHTPQKELFMDNEPGLVQYTHLIVI